MNASENPVKVLLVIVGAAAVTLLLAMGLIAEGVL